MMKKSYEKPEIKVSEGRKFERVYAGGCNMNSGADQTGIQQGEGTNCAQSPAWDYTTQGNLNVVAYGYGDAGVAPSN